jgi:hypothetical protein
MGRVILDTELRARLNGLNEQLEICDANGKLLGHFLPEQDYRRLLYAAVEAACPHGPQERERRMREAGGKSLAEFWRDLGVS